MKQTQKYTSATQILTFLHTNQDELYQELNRLGWYWQPKKKAWERDDTPALEASKLIKIRIWADSKKVDEAAALFIENAESAGLRLVEKSQPYPCRPPHQNDSRVYLTFEDLQN